MLEADDNAMDDDAIDDEAMEGSMIVPMNDPGFEAECQADFEADDKAALEKLRDSYTEFFCPPSNTLIFRPPTTEFWNYPTVMEIHIYTPDQTGDDQVTRLVTSGMSTRTQIGPTPHMELSVDVKGEIPIEAQEELAQQLVDLAIASFNEQNSYVHKMVFQPLTLGPFKNTDLWLLLDYWRIGKTDLPAVEPEVLLMTLLPFYEKEARLFKIFGKVDVSSMMIRSGIKLNDYDREPWGWEPPGPFPED